MRKEEILKKIRHGLIVSCQARKGWAMYGSDIMAAFAQAAVEGGASALRLNGISDIRKVKEKTTLPVIGINKIWTEGCEIYITPTYASAAEVLEGGIDIIALDATARPRPNGEKAEEIIKKIRENYPDVLIMGEISTLEEGLNAMDLDIDMISTTLSGYTAYSRKMAGPDISLISELSRAVKLPVIAEGRISTPEEAAMAFGAGAYSVVVGTAITRPEVITKKFVQHINTIFQET